MNADLMREVSRRSAAGHPPMSKTAFDGRLKSLGYVVAKGMHADHAARYLSGPNAGESYPSRSVVVVDAATGQGAFHVDARRDARFAALQIERFNQSLYYVAAGRIVEP